MTSAFLVVAVLALLAAGAAHVALLVRLALRPPRYRALVALVVPPLAPYWGWQEGARRLAGLWVGTIVIYALAVAVITR